MTTMHYENRISALLSANANSVEWATLAKAILADMHRAEGACEFVEKTVARQQVRIAELETALDAAQLHIADLEEEMNTEPGK